MTGTVYRGEIYYVHETETTGSEQYGGRPAIIVSNNVGNEHSPVVEVVYLTTQEKRQLPTHVDIFSAAKVYGALRADKHGTQREARKLCRANLGAGNEQYRQGSCRLPRNRYNEQDG